MMVTDLRCWSFFNILNRSPTSHSCHQHVSSPTPVINIDVPFEQDLVYRRCYIDVGGNN